MFCDSIAAIRAGLQGSNSESMPEGVDRRPWKPRPARQTQLLNNSVECHLCILHEQWPPPQRDEYMVLKGGIGAPPFEINLQGRLCGLMQWNEATFMELGTSNHQTIWSDVVEAEPNRFGHTEARARQQAEKRAVGIPAQTWTPKLKCGLNNAPDIVLGKDEWNGPSTRLAIKNSWGDFMPLILGMDISRKSNHFIKPASSLKDRWHRSSPLYGYFRADVVFAFCV
jgi:hypothetical protein